MIKENYKHKISYIIQVCKNQATEHPTIFYSVLTLS